ncbi:MAG: class I SAM-dependent methyltransferase [Ignavibacteriae bacterium]|nr:class I SAM-dependent methyltransferase [Ignavibacteriota bacterium]
MTTEQNAEQLKQKVREYWNANPCGTQFAHTDWGTKEFFDEVERFRYSSQPFMKELVGFDRFAGKRLLEIGCGLGTDLFQFARGGASVTGTDLTPRSIELAKARFDMAGVPAQMLVADAENLPFENDSFDVVYSFGVLHHTPNTEKAIREAYRVLRPGGTIILMLYHKHSLHVYLGAPLYWLAGKIRKGSLSALENYIRIYDGDENPLGKAYSRSEARRMMRNFSNVRVTLCDPIRRKYSRPLNTVNQLLFARWLGFWMVLKGKKPA